MLFQRLYKPRKEFTDLTGSTKTRSRQQKPAAKARTNLDRKWRPEGSRRTLNEYEYDEPETAAWRRPQNPELI